MNKHAPKHLDALGGLYAVAIVYLAHVNCGCCPGALEGHLYAMMSAPAC